MVHGLDDQKRDMKSSTGPVFTNILILRIRKFSYSYKKKIVFKKQLLLRIRIFLVKNSKQKHVQAYSF